LIPPGLNLILPKSVGQTPPLAFLAYQQQVQEEKKAKTWLYRDDIGAHWGIKGYEEMVTEVGTHHGHLNWPHLRFLG